MTATHDRAATIAERIALLAAVAVSLGVVGWVLVRCGAGIDFTDEGFYLNWLSAPSLYPASASQFGFVYHPLYRLVGGDVVLLRQLNIVITLALGWGLFALVFHRHVAEVATDRLAWYGLSLVLATSTLMMLFQWLPTPNYRSLALQSLLVCGIGGVLGEDDRRGRAILGSVLLGLGGWLAFMAKPTTAAAVGILAVAFLPTARPRLRMLATAAATALLLLLASAFLLDGSVRDFGLRLTEGARDLQRMGGGYAAAQVLRLDRFHLTTAEVLMFIGAATFVAVATWLASAGRGAGRVAAALATLAASAFAVQRAADPAHAVAMTSEFLGAQFLACMLGAAIAARTIDGARRGAPASRRVPLWLFFLGFPAAFVIGTNTNYWASMSSAVAFWVVCGVLVVLAVTPHARWRQLLPLAVAAQALVVAVLLDSTERPYRQTVPLRLQRVERGLSAASATVRVSEDVARYLQSLQIAAGNAGFRPGDMMIDLTGHYPLVPYLLGGRALGLPWLLGGYPGSAEMASAALARVPRDSLRAAWVLLEPAGPRRIPFGVLTALGIDTAAHYVVAGTFQSPAEDYPQRYAQVLLRPALTSSAGPRRSSPATPAVPALR